MGKTCNKCKGQNHFASRCTGAGSGKRKQSKHKESVKALDGDNVVDTDSDDSVMIVETESEHPVQEENHG